MFFCLIIGSSCLFTSYWKKHRHWHLLAGVYFPVLIKTDAAALNPTTSLLRLCFCNHLDHFLSWPTNSSMPLAQSHQVWAVKHRSYQLCPADGRLRKTWEGKPSGEVRWRDAWKAELKEKKMEERKIRAELGWGWKGRCAKGVLQSFVCHIQHGFNTSKPLYVCERVWFYK